VKPGPKALLTTALIVASIFALTWIAGLLYWQIHLGIAIREWEASYQEVTDPYNKPRFSEEREEIFRRAGCRALPGLVAAMHSPRDPYFQSDVMFKVICILVGPRGDRDSVQQFSEWEHRWLFDSHTPEYERRQKLADFEAWWRVHGAEYHQVWRFWSANQRTLGGAQLAKLGDGGYGRPNRAAQIRDEIGRAHV